MSFEHAKHRIRVELPAPLLRHVKITAGHEVALEVAAPVTTRRVLDALEALHPTLCGTIRDQTTLERRAFIRFFACNEDISFAPPDDPLPEAVIAGREPLIVLGAIAGG
ncbi:MAG TPA: MoaD/ThiS family protein [Candidatus Aquilonibacter sp.]|nr:MoaD/ThiS family protein [Candidatus Aquilonibacter sp.]